MQLNKQWILHLYQLVSPELEAGKRQMLAGIGHTGSMNWGNHPGEQYQYLIKLDGGPHGLSLNRASAG